MAFTMKKEPHKDKTTMTAREVAVLVEDFRSQFRTFGEKLKSIDDKLDSTMGMVAKNTEDITWLRMLYETTKQDITKISGKLAKIEEDLRIIKEDFSKRLTNLESIQ
jgi:septation ring formation regulator EzrA